MTTFIYSKKSSLSLKGRTLNLFENEMIKETLKKFKIKNKCILILDEKGMKILSKFLTVSEAINMGLLSLESISLERQPFKNYSAIYYISPSESSIEKIINDFKNEKKRLYKYAHIFFTDPVPENKLEKLCVNNVINRILTCKEVNLNFLTLDSNLYNFGSVYNFNSLYQLYKFNEDTAIYESTIDILFSICTLMDVYPNIIYFVLDKNCKKLATDLNKRLSKYYKSKQKNGILLINSRLMDLTAPLNYDMTYSNLIFDKFKKENNEIEMNEKGEKKTYVLDDNDPLYSKYKSLNISELSSQLPEDFQQFIKSDTAKAFKNKNYNSLNDMEKAINNLGEYKYLAGLFNKHLDLANLIKNDLKERKIANVIEIENSILSGIDSEGKKIGYKELLKQMKSLKNDLKKSEVKRLLSMLYFFNSEMDLDDIIDDINENFDASISKSERKIIKFFNKDNTQINADEYRLVDKEIINFRKNNKHNTKEDNENKNDKRYICYKEAKITTFIEMCSKNQIPNSLFEWVEEPSNLKKVGKKYKANFIEINNKQVDDDFDENRPNLILYNIGGLSHYEVSSIEKANNNKQFNYNIIIGSNKIYNAKEYFNEIEKFNEGKSGFNKDFRSKDKDDNTEIGTKDIKLQINNSDDSDDLK